VEEISDLESAFEQLSVIHQHVIQESSQAVREMKGATKFLETNTRELSHGLVCMWGAIRRLRSDILERRPRNLEMRAKDWGKLPTSPKGMFSNWEECAKELFVHIGHRDRYIAWADRAILRLSEDLFQHGNVQSAQNGEVQRMEFDSERPGVQPGRIDFDRSGLSAEMRRLQSEAEHNRIANLRLDSDVRRLSADLERSEAERSQLTTKLSQMETESMGLNEYIRHVSTDLERLQAEQAQLRSDQEALERTRVIARAERL
jgi:hypothetical protein